MSIKCNKSKNNKTSGKKSASEQASVLSGNFKIDDHAYIYPEDRDVILELIKKAPKTYAKHDKELGNIYYYNIPASFDTETTSTYLQGEKIAIMYVWMFSVEGRVVVGRTWDEFEELMLEIGQLTSLTNRLIVYVHNLGFDFSFYCRRLTWYKTFCIQVREPIYAITIDGIEFRDSYILTGKSLASSAKDLLKYKVAKRVGDLDYTLVRGIKTPLTEKELGYCIFDCLVLDAIIQEKIEAEQSITKIPLTNTGYVRRFMKQMCYPGKRHNHSGDDHKATERYKTLMQELTMTPQEYQMLKRAFMGGFTHANAMYVDTTFTERVDSFDFTSSYPAVILSEQFPMTKAEHKVHVTAEEFNDIIKYKLAVFDIRFNNIRAKSDVCENYISISKGVGKNTVENNGRLVSADQFTTTITNIDMEIIRQFYDCDSIQVGEMLVYEKGYLPKPIIKGVLELYKGKTSLKGVAGSEQDYQLKKGMLNSVYGCMVTDPVKAVVEYTNSGWSIDETDLDKAIQSYNTSKSRFLYYPWGIFVTAYARRNLFMGIQEFGADYIYSDTDSIKCINAKNHMGFIDWYNDMITTKVRKCLEVYDIDPSASAPKTIKGVPKPIGVWDWETETEPYEPCGNLGAFKTLGAKRYMYTQGGEIHITIAGLGKKSGAEYISQQESPYDFFSDDMNIPADATGKLLHTYLDKETSGVIIDYEGRKNEFHELGGVHLEKTHYTLELSSKFKEYLESFRESYEEYCI